MNKKTIEYFKGDELAAQVWWDKYRAEGEETPDDMHKRLAKGFSRVEDKYTYLENEILSKYPEGKEVLSLYGQIRDDLTKEKIYNLFKDFKYIIPQGSVMSQLGANSIGSLSNCFVIGKAVDSYGGIFQKDEEMAQLMKRRGGVGIDISDLRPKGLPTTNAAKTSTGAISFMHRFSNTTREVAQNGRRGALMISIDINHPDVMEFIKIKRDLTQVTGANISIKINNEFMKAVENDEDYILRFPCDLSKNYIESDLKSRNILFSDCDETNKLYAFENAEIGKYYIKVVKAKEYWDEIIKSAHGVAEPGIIFEDNHHEYSPESVYPEYKGITTNPCGEIFMQPYDACRLIAVNLFSFVKNPFTEDAYFDYDKFYAVNYEAMRLSDDLVDLELGHINRIINKIHRDRESEEVKRTELNLWKKVRDTAKNSRRTGLGFTALGDTLAALGLAYDSDEGLQQVDRIMDIKMQSELDCTIDLAILRGTFEGWNVEKEFGFIEKDGITTSKYGNYWYLDLYNIFPHQAQKMMEYGRRNVSFSTVAPTGSVSLLAQVTSGIEPLFQPFYMRRKKINNDKERVDFVDENGDKWQEFPVLHQKFKEWINTNFDTLGLSGQQDIEDEMSQKDLQKAFEQSPWYNSTANDIDWIKRVEMQSIIQKYITHSISSTINLPEDVSTDEVSKIYIESWKQNLKGITVYRDGSRSGVLVNTDTKAENEDNVSFTQHDAPKRPKKLECEIHTTVSKGKKWNVFIGLLEDKPYEVFAVPYFTTIEKGYLVKIKRGRYDLLNEKEETYSEDITSQMNNEEEVVTRLTSTALRHGTDIKFLVEQLNKSYGDITSFNKAIARVLKKYIPNGTKMSITCNECGSEDVIFQEGCMQCTSCGNSNCS